MKKIDSLHLTNCRLSGHDHNAYEFEALRLISKSDQAKDGKLEAKLEEFFAFDDFEKKQKRVEFKLKHKHHISALHSGNECSVQFKFLGADQDQFFKAQEPFIVIRPHPCALASQDSYSIRVAVEYPDSYPSSDHHKLSVVFLGALHSDAFRFEWFYRTSRSSPWKPFDHTLLVENETETLLPAARMSSKRFQGDSLEYVRVVVREGPHFWSATLAEVEVLIIDDRVQRPMPSQGRCIEKKPIGIRVPLSVINSGCGGRGGGGGSSSSSNNNLLRLAGAARGISMQ